MVSFEQQMRSLLRGEIAAAESYAQVLEDGTHPHAKQLRDLQSDHGRAIKFLGEQLTARGFEVPSTSGAWGQLVRLVEGGAKILGNRTALSTLREGERRGLRDYEQAAQMSALPAACRSHIEHELLPAQRRHVAQLDRMLQNS